MEFDFEAVNRWAAAADRKPAIHAFTAGVERQVAILIERGVGLSVMPAATDSLTATGRLTRIEAATRGALQELVIELDGGHFEAQRFTRGTPAIDVANRLRMLAARIEHRASAATR